MKENLITAKKAVLFALLYTWALPTTALGFAVGILLTFLGQVQRVTFLHGFVVEFVLEAEGWVAKLYKKIDSRATTLGCVIFYASSDAHADHTLVLHESGHVGQALRLGPLYLPTYALIWGLIWLGCPMLDAYAHHPMELDAEVAGKTLAEQHAEAQAGAQGEKKDPE